jgi:hypothetical protein
MEAFTDIFAFMAGAPAIAGLILTGAAIFLASDWRLYLTGLLVQYVLVGLALTRFVPAEVAIVKILVGVLAVSILYLTARNIQGLNVPEEAEGDGGRFLALQMGWRAGPLGLPLRLLAVLLVSLAVIQFFDEYRALLPALTGQDPTFPLDVAFVTFWLGGIGLTGLILSGEALRVAPALLTILAGFDLMYAALQPTLAIVGFLAALILLVALAFSYLAIVQQLGTNSGRQDLQASSLPAGLSTSTRPDEEGGAE